MRIILNGAATTTTITTLSIVKRYGSIAKESLSERTK